MSKQSDSRVEAAIRQLEVAALNFAYQATNIGSVRQNYIRRTQDMTRNLRAAYASGEMSAKAVAQVANEMRNVIMEQQRVNSAAVGRAMAQKLKAKGLPLDLVLDQKAQRLFKQPFAQLDNAQQTAAYLEVVESAGRTNAGADKFAHKAGAAGRAVFLLGLGLAAYNIANAKDKAWQAGREASSLGGGLGGSIGAGAVAGIWFGPISIGVGAFVGGVAGALLADEAYVATVGPSDRAAGELIKRFTRFMSTDEQGLVDALYREVGIGMDRVHSVFLALDESYTSDADDVAVLYLQQVFARGGSVLEALRLNVECRATLIRLLYEGWTTKAETALINRLKALR